MCWLFVGCWLLFVVCLLLFVVVFSFLFVVVCCFCYLLPTNLAPTLFDKGNWRGSIFGESLIKGSPTIVVRQFPLSICFVACRLLVVVRCWLLVDTLKLVIHTLK